MKVGELQGHEVLLLVTPHTRFVKFKRQGFDFEFDLDLLLELVGADKSAKAIAACPIECAVRYYGVDRVLEMKKEQEQKEGRRQCPSA
jgi:hypothetical protein